MEGIAPKVVYLGLVLEYRLERGQGAPIADVPERADGVTTALHVGMRNRFTDCANHWAASFDQWIIQLGLVISLDIEGVPGLLECFATSAVFDFACCGRACRVEASDGRNEYHGYGK